MGLMGHPRWVVNFIEKAFPLQGVLARIANLPIIGSLAEVAFFRGDKIIYLPKDGTIRLNGSIPAPEDVVLPSQVVDQFIERASDHWVMDFCLCREGNHCQAYPKDYGCIFLGKAVRGIHPQLGRRVAKSEALAHARRCREAGLVQLVGRSKADTLWLGTGPGTQLLTICNCCSCCCLWNLLPQLGPAIGRQVVRMPGVHVNVTHDCTGCGLCLDGVCFTGAISLKNGRAVITEACRGCGRCVELCPQEAIALTMTDPGFIQKTVGEISLLVDIR